MSLLHPFKLILSTQLAQTNGGGIAVTGIVTTADGRRASGCIAKRPAELVSTVIPYLATTPN